jgi:hypothetical protein
VEACPGGNEEEEGQEEENLSNHDGVARLSSFSSDVSSVVRRLKSILLSVPRMLRG